jgi:hypothetical protein
LVVVVVVVVVVVAVVVVGCCFYILCHFGRVLLALWQELAADASSHQSGNSWSGLGWLAFSLFCDAFIGPKQEALKRRHHPTEYQLMLGTNMCGAIILLPCMSCIHKPPSCQS